ncbi:MAG: BrnT family toxin [Ardenticatenia bacterium]|nr:BrnT family toxin [Ardenticatenia bacterium]
MLQIAALVWDDWNVGHIARHAVTPSEVEEACVGEVVAWPTYKGRLLAIGRTTQGRDLAIVLEPTEAVHAYYVITARPASRRERTAYGDQLENIKP